MDIIRRVQMGGSVLLLMGGAVGIIGCFNVMHYGWTYVPCIEMGIMVVCVISALIFSAVRWMRIAKNEILKAIKEAQS